MLIFTIIRGLIIWANYSTLNVSCIVSTVSYCLLFIGDKYSVFELCVPAVAYQLLIALYTIVLSLVLALGMIFKNNLLIEVFETFISPHITQRDKCEFVIGTITPFNALNFSNI